MMEKHLKLYTYVDGVNDTPFPNAEQQVVLSNFTYSANRMGSAPTITDTITHPLCLDDYCSRNVYATFNGEKYFLKNTPTSKKDNTSAFYSHEIELVSERILLDNIYFYDVVTDYYEGDEKQSGNLNIVFFGDIKEFARRLNASLTFSKSGYSVVVDAGIESETKQVSLDKVFFSAALQEVFNTFNLPYYFDNKVIHIGYTNNIVETTFSYGQKNNLLSIEKANSNFRIINRCSGYGSTDNIPYYYPNATPEGEPSLEIPLTNQGVTSDKVEIYDEDKFAKYLSVNDEIVFNSAGKDNLLGVVYSSYETNGEFSDLSDGITTKMFRYTDYRDGSMVIQFRFNIKNDDYATYKADISLFRLIGGKEPAVDFPWDKSHATIRGYNGVDVSVEDGSFFFTRQKDSTEDRPSAVIEILYREDEIPNYDYWNDRFYATIMIDSNDYWYYKNKVVDLFDFGIALSKDAVPVVGDKIIIGKYDYMRPQQTLMPPIYRQSRGAERFYNAYNNTYIKEDSDSIVNIGNKVTINNQSMIVNTYNQYYDFENEYTDSSRSENIIDLSDIKPTIECMENAQGLRMDMFEAIAYDDNDNDDFDKETNEYYHPYFYVKLRRFDGEYGFNLFEQANDSGEMTISMTSGLCGSCSFKVMVVETTDKDGRQIFKNPVQVDENGDIVTGDYDKKVSTANFIDSQQDTRNGSVWIALLKDQDTQGIIMPNNYSRSKPTTDDTFVILDIMMPRSYVLYAEKRLEKAIIEYMWVNNYERFNFSTINSRIFLANNPHIAEKLNENARIQISYNGKVYSIYVTSYTYKVSASEILPEISFGLEENLSVKTGSLQNTMNEIKEGLIDTLYGNYFITSQSYFFIRKDIDDVVVGKHTFKNGINVQTNAIFGKEGFASGIMGFGGKIDENANATFESLTLRRFLEVPELRYNRIDVKVGDKWRAPSAGIIESVDTKNKICYLKLEQGEIGNVSPDDICMGIFHSTEESENATENMDDSKGNRKFAGFCTTYFRVKEVYGDDRNSFSYELRPTSESWQNSFHPFVGMNFVGYGNFTNKERQSSVYETLTYTRMLKNQNDWEIGAKNIALQYGELSNLNVHGLDAEGYSLYVNNVYFTGQVTQVNDLGEPIITFNDRGEFEQGETYMLNDRVSYEGQLYYCSVESTTNAPNVVEGEWVLQVKKGEDGQDGKDGDDGISGCIMRTAEWKLGTEYRNDESLTSGTRFLDVALVRDDSTATGWKAYKCKVTHTSSSSNTPPNTTYWEVFGNNTTSIFTSLLIAKNATIDFIGTNAIKVKDNDGNVIASLGESLVPIYIGGNTSANSLFSVTEKGRVSIMKSIDVGNPVNIGIYAGEPTFNNKTRFWVGSPISYKAPFRVEQDGNFYSRFLKNDVVIVDSSNYSEYTNEQGNRLEFSKLGRLSILDSSLVNTPLKKTFIDGSTGTKYEWIDASETEFPFITDENGTFHQDYYKGLELLGSKIRVINNTGYDIINSLVGSQFFIKGLFIETSYFITELEYVVTTPNFYSEYKDVYRVINIKETSHISRPIK